MNVLWYVEPLDTVYISNLATGRNRYHRPDRPDTILQVTTHCARLQLLDCKSMPEVEAALTREPCLRCFPVRGRRGRIPNLVLVAGVPDA